ncbi:hypothetical protein AX16_010100, partial [Volvariella volvacea WC 439]
MDASPPEKADIPQHDAKHANGNAGPTLSKANKDYLDKLTSLDLGIWRIWIDKATGTGASKNFSLDLPTARRFLCDIYKINPFIFVMLLIGKLWDGVEQVVLLSFSSKVLGMIEEGLKTGKPNTTGILHAALMRLLIVIFVAVFRWW